MTTVHTKFGTYSCQRYKPSLAKMGSKPPFRSSLPAQVSLKVTGIKCLSHLLKRAVPFWRQICIVAHVDTTGVALNLFVVEPTKACQRALPAQAVPRRFWGHWILCLTPLLPSKHRFYASLDANRSRMESSSPRRFYPLSDKGELWRCASPPIALVPLSVSTIRFNLMFLGCTPWNGTTHPNGVWRLAASGVPP